ncbi:MAG: hypothetical protein VB934_15820 [Polyangiaceae bacterium]
MSAVPMRVLRYVYRTECIPARLRWWLAARGMRDWLRIVTKELRPHLGSESRSIMATLAARCFERRYQVLRESLGHLPTVDEEPRAVALVMSGLYRIHAASPGAWILDGLGGAAATWHERREARRLIAPLSTEDRWREVTVHLGEWLIVLTEELPERLPRARQIVADICFRMGVRYGETMREMFALSSDENQPALAIEVLRMSEYIFRVNPKHWGESDEEAGWIEGNACPWFERPGWQQVHCGIFGQFQSGISSVFGLNYKLTKTIPKHGGNTCRIDLKPLRIRRDKHGPAVGTLPVP